MDQVNLSQSTAFQLKALAKQMETSAEQILQEELGIGYVQFTVLLVVQSMDQPSQREVAECMRVTPGTISRQVEQLCDEKLISRQYKEGSRRDHVLEVTKAGEGKLGRAQGILGERFDALLGKEPPEDVETFKRVLHNLNNGMQTLLEEGEIK